MIRSGSADTGRILAISYRRLRTVYVWRLLQRPNPKTIRNTTTKTITPWTHQAMGTV